MDLLVIVLTDSSSFDVKLVPASALPWIESPRPTTPSAQEPIPANVVDDLKTMGVSLAGYSLDVTVSSGSADNDRALAIPGHSISLVEMYEYLNTEQSFGKPKLVAEYVGFQY